ncbi:MAG: hypothetical protein JRN15_17375 [Nitrososphaerota archaeon]|nr:hypothetical protein [Nitrososphaerota archaeon]
MESSQTEIVKAYHLPKTNRVVTGKNSRVGRGLGQHCYLCGKLIEKLPYFSHLSGGAHRMHYYHIECAKKVNLL